MVQSEVFVSSRKTKGWTTGSYAKTLGIDIGVPYSALHNAIQHRLTNRKVTMASKESSALAPESWPGQI